MPDQLSIVGADVAPLDLERDPVWEAARARIVQPNAPNTARAYEQAYKRWRAYCDALDRPWGPIDPAHFCRYLESLSRDGLAPNSVRVHMSALSELDKAYRFSAENQNPPRLRDHPIVSRWYQSWSREHPEAPQSRASALDATALERILRAAAEPRKNAARGAHAIQYVRDRCLILFGVVGAFRANDLTQLTLSDVEPNERGLRVRLPRSKTDQTGKGKWRGLMPQAKLLRCPVDAYHQWRKLRGDEPGPLFVATTRAGALDLGAPLSERSIHRLVSGYATRAGLDLVDTRYSSHSMRRTFATLAAAQRKPIDRMMRHGGWESAQTVMGYIDEAELFDDNPTAGLLD